MAGPDNVKKSTPSAEEIRVEDAVLSAAWAQDAKPSPMLERFIEEMLPRFRLGPTGIGIIEAFSSMDVKAENVAVFLRANPYYEFQFLKIIQSLSKRENLPSVEAAIVLLGMQKSRDMIMAMQIVRMVGGTHPEWSKEGKLMMNQQDILKYALKTEDSLTGTKSPYSDTAYASGMIFDILTQVAAGMGVDPKKLGPYIDQLHGHGLRAAKTGAELVGAFQDFTFKKYVFAACLLHDIGKGVMATLDISYLDFLEECRKKELPRQVLLYLETKKYGVNHAHIGMLVLEAFDYFKPMAKAVLLHHDPYVLKKKNKNLYQLAALICLSTNVASFFRKPEKSDDPVVKLWKGAELKDFTISTADLIARVGKIVAKG